VSEKNNVTESIIGIAILILPLALNIFIFKLLWITVVGIILSIFMFIGAITPVDRDKVYILGSLLIFIACVSTIPSYIEHYNEQKVIKAVESENQRIREVQALGEYCKRSTSSYIDFEYCANGGDMSDSYEGESGGSNGPGTHYVEGYYRSDGTYVSGYKRSNPDGNPYNNLKP
jgi:hypothetical protein